MFVPWLLRGLDRVGFREVKAMLECRDRSKPNVHRAACYR